MIDTTSRQDRRGARARARLDRLIRQAGDERIAELPADQPWLDLSPEPVPVAAPAWRPDAGARDTGPGAPEPERALTPAAEPWWRRRLRQLAERWSPGAVDERPPWRLVAVAAGAVLVGVAVAAGLVTSGSGAAREVPPALPVASVSEVLSPGGTTPVPEGESIVVSVVGRVARPGLVTLPDGARVADALRASGGPATGVNLGGLNLARRLADGEQIYVGVPAPANAEPAGAASTFGTAAPGPVELNSASVAALDTLPGVGPVTAQRIVDWRARHGRFASVDQLREVEGIGPTRFAKLKDLVVVR